MNGLAWLLRMRNWVENPPSAGRVRLVVGVVALCLGLVIIERLFGWPDWLTLPGR